MKFLHLADLHLGKKFYDYSLFDDQKFVLNQAVDIVKDKNIAAVLISGDVFDRAVAPSFALELFSEFLEELTDLNTSIFIIPGNHDSAQRLSYLSPLVKKNNIFIAHDFEGSLEKVSLNKDIDIFLLPYIYPMAVKNYFPDEKILTYNDAVKLILDKVELDSAKTNILLAHQFVSSCESIYSDSEQKYVGGIESVDPSVFEKFDYTALGHLHCPQKVLTNKIRYAGSILKYSFSEINQKKSFTIIDIKEKDKIEFEFIEIDFLRDLKEYKGYIDDFLDEKFYSKIKKDDFLHFILSDESAIDAKKRLGAIFPNIALIEFDNSFTRNLNVNFSSNAQNKTILQHFCDFYSMQCEKELDETKKSAAKEIIKEIENNIKEAS